MARFRLRSWQEQTLYDSRDYEIDAGTLEEAAELLDELQEQAQEIAGPVELPLNVWCINSTGREMWVLDPDEIVDSERGIAEIGTDGRKLRDVLPAAASPPDGALATALAEFIRDIEAVGVETVREDWPDLVVTYEKARRAVAASAH